MMRRNVVFKYRGFTILRFADGLSVAGEAHGTWCRGWVGAQSLRRARRMIDEALA